PSRHRKERDDAALLTQEGNSPAFTVPIIFRGGVYFGQQHGIPSGFGIQRREAGTAPRLPKTPILGRSAVSPSFPSHPSTAAVSTAGLNTPGDRRVSIPPGNPLAAPI